MLKKKSLLKKSLLKKKLMKKSNIYIRFEDLKNKLEIWKFELEKLNQITPLYTIRRGVGGSRRRGSGNYAYLLGLLW